MRGVINRGASPGVGDVFRSVLPDGTVLLVRENPVSKAVVIQGLIRAGAVDDPVQGAGLCRFASECLTRGTELHTAGELYELVESVGASFGVAGGLHTIRFGARCLSEDFPSMACVLSEVFHAPSFPAAEIEKVRGEMLTEIAERDNDTRSVTDLAFRRQLYRDEHPYSRASDGETETVEAFSRDDVSRFFHMHVVPRPAIISVVGNVQKDAVPDLLAPLWAGSQRTSVPPPLPGVVPLGSTVSTYTVLPGKVQTDIAWGAVGPTRRDPDFVAASVANLVLGGFGLMGRLGQQVREKMGLAYYATSRFSGGLGPGPWACVAGVAPENLSAAVRAIEHEVQILRETPVPTDELEDCKSHLTGSLPLKLESNEGVASVMSEIELHGLGWDYLDRFPELVEAVTQDDVQRVVARFLPAGREALAGSGPEVPA